MTLAYTDPKLVSEIWFKPMAHHKAGLQFTASGYGGRIPTRWMIRYAGRWRRVYMMVYSNAGTAYIFVKGGKHIVDIDTQHRITTYGQVSP